MLLESLFYAYIPLMDLDLRNKRCALYIINQVILMENKKSEQKTGVLKSIFDLLEDFVLIFGVFCIVLTFVVRQITVDGISMQPNYYDYERVLISGQPGKLSQGDVVVVVNAIARGPVIKRVVATQGQTVDFDENTGSVVVDGVPFDDSKYNIQPGITDPSIGGSIIPGKYPVTVPQGNVFVLGDNRQHSMDSRAFGVVDERNILGKALWKFYPISEFGKAK